MEMLRTASKTFMRKILLRQFNTISETPSCTSAVAEEPHFLTLKSGTVIPYPRGIMSPIEAHEVVTYGEDALKEFVPETSHANKLYNIAQLRYLETRNKLLQGFRGKWAAVSTKGVIIVAGSEKEVRKYAELVFPFGVDEYHAACIGCEVMTGVSMDSSVDNDGDGEFQLPQSSSIWGFRKEFYVDAEHSFTGQDFKPFSMKHAMGAQMMGVPAHILSNPPNGVTIVRGRGRFYIEPSGKRSPARVYKNHFIKIAGLSLQVNVIESRSWVLGFPILSRFRNIFDVTAKEVVELQPLPMTT